MIHRNHNLQKESENGILGFIDTIHWQYWNVQHCQRPLVPAWAEFHFHIQRTTTYYPKYQKVSTTVLWRRRYWTALFSSATNVHMRIKVFLRVKIVA